jgi:hypothetical protein
VLIRLQTMPPATSPASWSMFLRTVCERLGEREVVAGEQDSPVQRSVGHAGYPTTNRQGSQRSGYLLTKLGLQPDVRILCARCPVSTRCRGLPCTRRERRTCPRASPARKAALHPRPPRGRRSPALDTVQQGPSRPRTPPIRLQAGGSHRGSASAQKPRRAPARHGEAHGVGAGRRDPSRHPPRTAGSGPTRRRDPEHSVRPIFSSPPEHCSA